MSHRCNLGPSSDFRCDTTLSFKLGAAIVRYLRAAEDGVQVEVAELSAIVQQMSLGLLHAT